MGPLPGPRDALSPGRFAFGPSPSFEFDAEDGDGIPWFGEIVLRPPAVSGWISTERGETYHDVSGWVHGRAAAGALETAVRLVAREPPTRAFLGLDLGGWTVRLRIFPDRVSGVPGQRRSRLDGRARRWLLPFLDDAARRLAVLRLDPAGGGAAGVDALWELARLHLVLGDPDAAAAAAVRSAGLLGRKGTGDADPGAGRELGRLLRVFGRAEAAAALTGARQQPAPEP